MAIHRKLTDLISVDLVSSAITQLEFLRLVDNFPCLYSGPHLQNAIRRYELFWLPLAKNVNDSGKIAAPLDIAWVWHVHMLAPQYYERDCRNVVSKLVNHQPKAGDARNTGLSNARLLWMNAYPDEPFEVDFDSPAGEYKEYSSKIEYHITSASARQQVFFYQVSLPHYRNRKFLETAVKRYKFHIELTKQNPSQFLVPCFDYDLIWHAHQLHPLAYRFVTQVILGGKVLNYDDSVNDRSPGSKLIISERITRALWEISGRQFSKHGAMFRGIPPLPADVVSASVSNKYHSLASPNYEVELLGLEFENLLNNKEYDLELSVVNGRRICKEKVRGPRSLCCEGCNEPICVFPLDTEHNNSVKVHVSRQGFCACCLGDPSDDTSVLPFSNFLRSVTYGSALPTPVTHTVTCGDEKCVRFTTRIRPPKRGSYCFTVCPEPKFILVQNAVEMLNSPALILSPTVLTQGSGPCSMNVHKIVDQRQQKVFSCRVMHSAVSKFSSVEIMDVLDCVVASAHLVGSDVLPSANQVNREEMCCTLDLKAGERAMLVRGRKDWAICVGKWKCKSKARGVPKTARVSGRATKVSWVKENCWKPDNFDVKYFCLQNNKWHYIERKGKILYYPGHNGSQIEINLDSGDFTIPPEIDDIPENVALGFSVAILQLLCQPYFTKDALLATCPASGETSLSRHKSTNYASQSLMLAAGYYSTTVPTNDYVRIKRECGGCGRCDGCGGCGGCGCASTSSVSRRVRYASTTTVGTRSDYASTTTVGTRSDYASTTTVGTRSDYASTATVGTRSGYASAANSGGGSSHRVGGWGGGCGGGGGGGGGGDGGGGCGGGDGGGGGC